MMSDLISRSAMITTLEEYLQELDSFISEPDLKLDGYKNGLLVALNELKESPAVDAIVVVRCKDCKYAQKTESNERFDCLLLDCNNSGSFYCMCGERKELERK